MRLSWEGSRCWITTKANPLSEGMAVKSSFSASTPPAEAPMPTTRTGVE